MNTKESIGIFDSGIGGVTVLKEILKLLPNENYLYYSDSANNPYGDKSKEEINGLCRKIVDFFITKHCKAIVIACNTASAISAQYLRDTYPHLPIFAIEPAYKMVYDYSYNNPTLIMATKGTIESEKFNLLYHKYDNHKTILLPCIGLANLIEEGSKEKVDQYLLEHLEPYKGKIKNIVLGCTHYPLIQDSIEKILGNVEFYNGAPYLAKHLRDVLAESNLLNPSTLPGNVEFIDSSYSSSKRERFFKFLEL